MLVRGGYAWNEDIQADDHHGTERERDMNVSSHSALVYLFNVAV